MALRNVVFGGHVSQPAEAHLVPHPALTRTGKAIGNQVVAPAQGGGHVCEGSVT